MLPFFVSLTAPSTCVHEDDDDGDGDGDDDGEDDDDGEGGEDDGILATVVTNITDCQSWCSSLS